jgi:ABC-type transport system involved in cytochrome c biogenesis permease component
MNPILAREVRARWRDNLSFLLLFGLVSLLCVVILFVYSGSQQPDYDYRHLLDPRWSQTVRVSRALFKAITYGNLAGCLLLAPALSAPGLARERENGLLESLWLSQLKPRSLIAGRFWAAIGFLLLLEMAVLPLGSICLVLGGVGPGDLLLSFAIAVTAGVTGTAVGLWSSARAYRPTGALTSAYGAIAGWLLLVYVADFFYGTRLPASDPILLCLHPLTIAFLFTDPGSSNWTMFGSWRPSGTLPDSTLWLGLGAQSLFGLLLLGLATRKAARPLPAPVWLSSTSPQVDKWRRSFENRKAAAEARRQARLTHSVEGALLAEIPLAKFVRFKNPLLQREVRSRFRLRRVPGPLQVLRLVGFITVAGFWVLTVLYAISPDTRADAGTNLGLGLLAICVPAIAIMSAQSFTRERESGTWESVRLSLLTPPELLRAKWLAPVITCFYWTLPLTVLLPICLGDRGLPGNQLMGAMLVVLSWSGLTSALGMFFSWHCRTTMAATGWTLGILALLFFGWPALLNLPDAALWISGLWVPSRPDLFATQSILAEYTLAWANPLRIMNALLHRYSYYYGYYSYYSYYAPGSNYPTPGAFHGVTTHLLLLWTVTIGCLRYIWWHIKRNEDEPIDLIQYICQGLGSPRA